MAGERDAPIECAASTVVMAATEVFEESGLMEDVPSAARLVVRDMLIAAFQVVLSFRNKNLSALVEELRKI